MDTLLAHCSVAFAQHGSLLAVFFIAGLTGGFTHCVAMCGPMVAAPSMTSMNCGGGCASSCGKGKALTQHISRIDISRIGQIPYHLGRMASYGVLGFFCALLSKQIATMSFWHWVSAAMLAIAGLLFVASSVLNCSHAAIFKSSHLGFLRGVLNGFIPCGMLYAALMMAATLADPIGAMVAMWLFVLGTLPALILTSATAGMMTRKWRDFSHYAGRAMMAFNGVSLLVMAGNLVR